jgi:hypothetical protein
MAVDAEKDPVQETGSATDAPSSPSTVANDNGPAGPAEPVVTLKTWIVCSVSASGQLSGIDANQSWPT